MGKKNRRRPMLKGKRNRQLPTHEAFAAGPIHFERHGRFTHIENRATPAQLEEMREAMRSAAAGAPARIDEIATEITSILALYDIGEILALLAMSQVMINPDTYKESTHKGKAHVLEYISLLALVQADEGKGRPAPTGADIQKLLDLASEASDLAVIQLQAAPGGIAAAQNAEADSVQFLARLNEFGLRNPAYEHNHDEVLDQLFANDAKQLRTLVGYNGADVIAVVRSIETLVRDRLSDRYTAAMKMRQELEALVNRRRRGRVIVDVPADVLSMVDGIVAMKPSRARLATAMASGMILFREAARDFIVSVDDLVQATNLPKEVVASVVSALSIGFGAVPPQYRAPALTHPLKESPLIAVQGGVHAANVILLRWAVQPLIENALKTDQKLWHRYEQHRHSVVTELAVRTVSRLMPTAKVGKNLFYPAPDQPGATAEVDALVVDGGVCLILEVKAADFSAPARRGAPERIRKDLNALVDGPGRQAERVWRYVCSQDTVSFSDAAGTARMQVSRAAIRYVFTMCVSLATIGHLTALGALEPSGIVSRRGVNPWFVSLYDLLVVGEILDPGPLFAHFISRRTAFPSPGVVTAHDELDFVMHYLREGLYFDEWAEKQPGVELGLASYTDSLDAYIFYRTGSRETPAPKPAPTTSAGFSKVVAAIQSGGAPMWLAACLPLLDLDEPSRVELARQVDAARRRASGKKEGANYSMSGSSGGGWGITYYVRRNRPDDASSLDDYVKKHKADKNAAVWVGLLDEGVSGPLIRIVAMAGPPTPNISPP